MSFREENPYRSFLRARRLRIVAVAAVLLALLEEPSLDAQQSLGVSGRLLDEQGGGLAGELVTLRRYPSSYERRLYDLGGELGEMVAQVRTSRDGGFSLETPGVGAWRLYLAEGSERVDPRRVDLAPFVATIELGEVELPATVAISVSVTDSEGRGVADAVVVADPVFAPDPRFRDRSVRPEGWRRATRSDEDGLAIVRLPRGQAWIRAAHPHWLMEEREISVGSVGGKETLQLTAGSLRTLEVVTERGESVAGAVLRMGEVQMPIGLTDGEGRIVVAGHEQVPVSYQVESSELGYGTIVVPPRPSEASAGPPLKVVLEPPVTLHGRVLDSLTGNPIGGALVWSRRRPSELTFTAPEGDYELATWDSQSGVLLGAVADGHMEGMMMASTSRLESRDIPTLGLNPAQRWRGRVVDSAGDAVAGAQLSFEVVGSEQSHDHRSQFLVASERDGSFSVELRAEAEHRLVVSAQGFAPGSRRLRALELGQVPEPLEIRLEKGVRVVGWVVGPDEEALPGVRVRLVLEEDGGRSRFWEDWGADAQTLPFVAQSESGREGRFVIEHASFGRYLLAAELEGYAPARVPGIEIEEGAGELEVGTLVLGRGHTLEGRVVTADGGVVAGAEVRLVEPGVYWGSLDPDAVSGVDGRFELGGLVGESTIELMVRHDEMAPSHYEGIQVPRDEPLEVVLEPGARLTGRVVDTEGAPVPATRLWLRPTSGRLMTRLEPLIERSDEDGSFSFVGLAQGEWVLSASADGLRELEQRVELTVGEVTSVEIRLDRGATLVGTVTDPDGRGVSGATVGLRQARFGGVHTLSVGEPSDAAGRFHVDGLPEAVVTLVVDHPRHPSVTEEVDLTSGQARLDVQLGEGVSLVGVVLDELGDPVSGARVMPLPQDGSFEAGPLDDPLLTGDNGRFRLDGLAAGRWVVQAEPPEGTVSSAARSDPVEVSAGDEPWIEIRLPRGVLVRGRIRGLDLDALSRVDVFADRIDTETQGTSFARPDYEGWFELGPLAPGQWQVAAQFGRRFVHAEIEVGPGLNEEIDLEFAEGFRLTGVVRSEGQPLMGASVSVFSSQTGSRSVATTDRDGAFTLEGLAGGSHFLIVGGRDGRSHHEDLQLEGDDHLVIEIEFRQLRGRVIAADSGLPVAGAMVGLAAGSAETDDDGRFELLVSDTGSTILSVIHSDYAHYQRTLTPEEGDHLEIALERTAELSLRVLRSDGSPLRRANVAWVGEGGEAVWGAMALPDGQGRLAVSGIPQGRQWVWVMMIDTAAAAALVEVEIPGPPIDVTLPVGGSIELVASASADGIVRLRHPATGALYPNAWAILSGAASIDAVPAGNWLLVWEGAEIPVTVPPGDRVRVLLDR